jgi:hypothetical protein
MDMDFAKRYPVLTAVLAVCVLAFAVEAFFVFREHKIERQAVIARGAVQQKLQGALALAPAPTAENLDAAKQNAQALSDQYQGIVAGLEKSSQSFPPPPPDSVGLLTDVQGFVSNFRDLAKDKDVVLPAPDFTFGMGQYVGHVSPPPANKIPIVYLQMQILQYLLNHLIIDAKVEGQEMMLEAVERENVAPVPGSASPNSPNNPNGSGVPDTFTIPPLVSARVPGAIDTLAFRITFIAYSDSLRLFLNELAKFELPLVVRSIEVSPASEDTITAAEAAGNTTTTDNGSAAAPVVPVAVAVPATPGTDTGNTTTADNNGEPVIKDNYSQFTVTVEYINLLSSTPAAPATAAP